MSSFANRVARAIRLDATVYEEIEHDPGALPQAMLTVAISSVATGIGIASSLGMPGLFWGLLVAFLAWVFWAAIIFFVGTRLLGTSNTKTDMGELLRVIGFASAPGFFRILGAFAPIQNIVFWVTGIWMLAAMIVAVRQALDFSSTARAVGVCVAGWLIQMLIAVLLVKIIEIFYATGYPVA